MKQHINLLIILILFLSCNDDDSKILVHPELNKKLTLFIEYNEFGDEYLRSENSYDKYGRLTNSTLYHMGRSIIREHDFKYVGKNMKYTHDYQAEKIYTIYNNVDYYDDYYEKELLRIEIKDDIEIRRVEYEYDNKGHLIKKTEYQNGEMSSISTYIYSGEIIKEYQGREKVIISTYTDDSYTNLLSKIGYNESLTQERSKKEYTYYDSGELKSEIFYRDANDRWSTEVRPYQILFYDNYVYKNNTVTYDMHTYLGDSFWKTQKCYKEYYK